MKLLTQDRNDPTLLDKSSAALSFVTIAFWFDVLDDLDLTEATQIIVLLDIGYNLQDALERYEDVCLFDGSAADYAYDLINETCEFPDYLSNYIDYDAIARDMKINGEITEISRELTVTNANEF